MQAYDMRKFHQEVKVMSDETMSNEQILIANIKDIVAERLGIDASTFDLDTDLAEKLGVDSLDYVEIIMELEDEFEIVIPDQEIESLKTLRQMVEYITRRLKEK